MWNVSSIKSPDGGIQRFIYDSDNRLKEHTLPMGGKSGMHMMRQETCCPKRMQQETLPGMHMMRQTGWCAWKRQTGQ